MKDNERQETISNILFNNVIKGMKLWNITDLNMNQLRIHDNLLWNARKARNSQQMKAKISFGNVAEEKPAA